VDDEGNPGKVIIEHLEGDTWLVMDEEGTPIGTIKVPDGMTIDEIDIMDHLIPLGHGYLPGGKHPVTSDDGVFGWAVTGGLLLGGLVFCLYQKKRMKKEDDVA